MQEKENYVLFIKICQISSSILKLRCFSILICYIVAVILYCKNIIPMIEIEYQISHNFLHFQSEEKRRKDEQTKKIRLMMITSASPPFYVNIKSVLFSCTSLHCSYFFLFPPTWKEKEKR